MVLPRPEDRPSEPEPDAAVVRGNIDDYKRRHPGPGDVALVVEVSDTTYGDDSGEFLRQYAAAGIPLYWIVNIARRRIEVYSSPSGSSSYAVRHDFGLGDAVPLQLDRFGFEAIAVIEILGDSIE